MKLAVLNTDGKELRRLEVDDAVFGIEPNVPVLHQAFVTQRANQRWGTANTKTRGEVQGSTKKIRMQKYTGRARQGSIRAPHHVGGGTVFGPRQRSYAKDLNKKMRRLAIRSALSSKVADGQLVLVDRLAFDTPRTKEMIRILKNVGIERSVLVVTGEADRMVLASVRNLQKTKALPAAYLNVVDMLNYNKILITEDAVRVAEQLWGSRVPVPAPDTAKAPSRKPAAKAKAADAPVPAPAPAKPAPAVRAKAEAPAEEKPDAAPAPKAPPRRAAAKAEKAPAPEAEAKPARRARAPKAEAPAQAAPEAETKPRRRVKKTEGEG
ncbi:MAG TPA: 50S ribosomal protein L4 [Dehalococcoidia bacterium]|nr:50S ribosomal protein L4 [Dehalococcoidia bacterium]